MGSFESTWETDLRRINELGAAEYLRVIEGHGDMHHIVPKNHLAENAIPDFIGEVTRIALPPFPDRQGKESIARPLRGDYTACSALIVGNSHGYFDDPRS